MSEEQDPVFLITGASSGIGEATARQAAERGYRLVLAARREDKVSALAEELGGPDRALATRCDVTDWGEQQALVQTCLERFGRIDVAYANAGIPGSPGGFSGAAYAALTVILWLTWDYPNPPAFQVLPFP